MSKEIAWNDVPKAIARSSGHDTDTYFLRENLRNIMELRNQGKSIDEISKLTGYDKNAVEWAIDYVMKHKMRSR